MERTVWTDERLNDSFKRLETSIDKLDRRFDDLYSELDAEFAGIRSTLDHRFDALQRQLFMLAVTMMTVLGGVIAAGVGAAIAF